MRLLHLRRPPVIRAIPTPFVPRCDLADVDRRWKALCAGNPAFFDGRLLHVLAVSRNGHGGATVHVAECAYRYWAVGVGAAIAGGGDHAPIGTATRSHRGTAAGGTLDTGVRPLGVKAIVTCDEHVLMGRRSHAVAAYAGFWEFAPGGAVEPDRDLRDMVLAELVEETGLRLTEGDRVTARGILFDDVVRSWEAVFVVELRRSACPVVERAPAEYADLRWIPRSAVRGLLASSRGRAAGGRDQEGPRLPEITPLTDCAKALIGIASRAASGAAA